MTNLTHSIQRLALAASRMLAIELAAFKRECATAYRYAMIGAFIMCVCIIGAFVVFALTNPQGFEEYKHLWLQGVNRIAQALADATAQ